MALQLYSPHRWSVKSVYCLIFRCVCFPLWVDNSFECQHEVYWYININIIWNSWRIQKSTITHTDLLPVTRVCKACKQPWEDVCVFVCYLRFGGFIPTPLTSLSHVINTICFLVLLTNQQSCSRAAGFLAAGDLKETGRGGWCFIGVYTTRR